MPRLAIDYAKNFNYKIVCKDLSITDSYAGASTNWPKRKNSHKSNCHNEKSKEYNKKIYTFIRDHGGWENWEMILIEYFPCKTQLESAQRERFWTETLKATLNCNVQGRTNKEYKADHNEYLIIQRAEHYQINKEHIAEQQAVYQAGHKEQIAQRKAVPYTCICGLIICKGSKFNHLKSKKHQSFILANPIIQVQEPSVNIILQSLK
jgi:hypothetical protein